jgi:hypothetical protein
MLQAESLRYIVSAGRSKRSSAQRGAYRFEGTAFCVELGEEPRRRLLALVMSGLTVCGPEGYTELAQQRRPPCLTLGIAIPVLPSSSPARRVLSLWAVR